jgi:hypothetical protein
MGTNTEPFNRGHDDLSIQYGSVTVDGLTFDGCRSGRMPLIQISDDNPTGAAVSHFRNVKLVNWNDKTKSRALVNLGGGPRPKPKFEKGVPIYLHDWFGAKRHALVVSTKSPEYAARSAEFREETSLTGDESRVTDAKDIEFPKLLDPIDDLPPATVITHTTLRDGKRHVQGTCSDNGEVRSVVVNGSEAEATSPNFATWQIMLDAPHKSGAKLEAHAVDAAGNKERLPHRVN